MATGNAGFILHFIKNPTGPFAPSGDAGISSGLAAMTTSASPTSGSAPAWLVSRLESAGDLNSGEIADYFRQLAAEDSAADQDVLIIDDVQSELGFDDELLDSLLANVGLD